MENSINFDYYLYPSIRFIIIKKFPSVKSPIFINNASRSRKFYKIQKITFLQQDFGLPKISSRDDCSDFWLTHSIHWNQFSKLIFLFQIHPHQGPLPIYGMGHPQIGPRDDRSHLDRERSHFVPSDLSRSSFTDRTRDRRSSNFVRDQ